METIGDVLHRYRMARRFLRKGSRSLWQRIEGRWWDYRKSMRYFAPSTDEPTGRFGERLAVEYLRRSGYFILERSYACSFGEIDIIAAWKATEVVYIEVKTWSIQRENQGGPADAVDQIKQQKICRTALHYAKRHGLLDTPGRFDVIEVVLGRDPRRPNFRHIQSAFESQAAYQMHA